MVRWRVAAGRFSDRDDGDAVSDDLDRALVEAVADAVDRAIKEGVWYSHPSVGRAALQAILDNGWRIVQMAYHHDGLADRLYIDHTYRGSTDTTSSDALASKWATLDDETQGEPRW